METKNPAWNRIKRDGKIVCSVQINHWQNKVQKFGEMLSVQVMGVAGISSPHLPGMSEW